MPKTWKFEREIQSACIQNTRRIGRTRLKFKERKRFFDSADLRRNTCVPKGMALAWPPSSSRRPMATRGLDLRLAIRGGCGSCCCPVSHGCFLPHRWRKPKQSGGRRHKNLTLRQPFPYNNHSYVGKKSLRRSNKSTSNPTTNISTPTTASGQTNP
jgi:hypothetical protein